MRARTYLPSKQFSAILLSLLLSVGLVYAADLITKPGNPTKLAVATDASGQQHDSNWQNALNAIQAQEGSSSLPETPDQNILQNALEGAKSSNLTDTVSRTLLINLSNAKSQGLGDDVPTQNQIITSAISQIQPSTADKKYTADDIQTADDTPSNLKNYGNLLAVAIAADANNNFGNTYIAIDAAMSNQDESQLKPLKQIQAEYIHLVADLVRIPVPKTLVPFHLQLLNNFQQIADTYPDMEVLISDPIRGLTAMQQYQSLATQTGKVFISIAQSFSKNGILFNKDEPGALWTSLLEQQQ